MKKIPTAKMITITKEAQDMLKFFESGPNQDIKKINGIYEKKEKKETKEIKKKEEKIIIQKEIRDLDENEFAECVQEVVYKIIAGMDKELEELSEKESGKIARTAFRIVEYVRNY